MKFTPLVNCDYLQDIIVSGTDVYISGVAGFNVAYWKNGVATVFPTEPGGQTELWFGMAVINNNVYLTGAETIERNARGIRMAKYWKNGVGFVPDVKGEITAADMTGINNGDFHAMAVYNEDVYNVGHIAFREKLYDWDIALFKNKEQIPINPLLVDAWDICIAEQ